MEDWKLKYLSRLIKSFCKFSNLSKFLLTFISINSQSVKIKSIDIASKMNGVSIKIYSDLILKPNQVAGWFNESTSWYYMTIHQAEGDTASLELTKLANPIREVEVIKVGESLQIGFRIKVPVENFEFYFYIDLKIFLA